MGQLKRGIFRSIRSYIRPEGLCHKWSRVLHTSQDIFHNPFFSKLESRGTPRIRTKFPREIEFIKLLTEIFPKTKFPVPLPPRSPFELFFHFSSNKIRSNKLSNSEPNAEIIIGDLWENLAYEEKKEYLRRGALEISEYDEKVEEFVKKADFRDYIILRSYNRIYTQTFKCSYACGIRPDGSIVSNLIPAIRKLENKFDPVIRFIYIDKYNESLVQNNYYVNPFAEVKDIQGNIHRASQAGVPWKKLSLRDRMIYQLDLCERIKREIEFLKETNKLDILYAYQKSLQEYTDLISRSIRGLDYGSCMEIMRIISKNVQDIKANSTKD